MKSYKVTTEVLSPNGEWRSFAALVQAQSPEHALMVAEHRLVAGYDYVARKGLEVEEALDE